MEQQMEMILWAFLNSVYA
uniref:Uncharacterized protein n=1 Tax=Arundo donax TaxID=35708 RepID=A0A0A9GXY8_ARUDO